MSLYAALTTLLSGVVASIVTTYAARAERRMIPPEVEVVTRAVGRIDKDERGMARTVVAPAVDAQGAGHVIVSRIGLLGEGAGPGDGDDEVGPLRMLLLCRGTVPRGQEKSDKKRKRVAGQG